MDKDIDTANAEQARELSILIGVGTSKFLGMVGWKIVVQLAAKEQVTNFLTARGGTKSQSYSLAAVESHQRFPAHQQVSSGDELRRNERTLFMSPRLKASASFFAVSSLRAPTQGMNITGIMKRASYLLSGLRVISSIPPAPGVPPGPSGVRGMSSLPLGAAHRATR